MLSVTSWARKRRGAASLSPGAANAHAPALKRAAREIKVKKNTVAMEWMLSAPAQDAELVATLRSLPPAVLNKVRLFGVGHGTRVRHCLLCESHSNSPDPILGERAIVLWGHLDDDDGVSVLGMIDFYCVGVMRRRWVGWKLAELHEHFQSNVAEREKHKRWRELDIAFILANGFQVAVTAHVSDGGVDTTRKSIKSKHAVVETFHCGQDALWPVPVFTSFFDMSPQEAGYKELTYPQPNGGSLSGVRLPHDPKMSLPEGVILISKDFKIEVRGM